MVLFFSASAFALTWQEALTAANNNSNSIKSAEKQLESSHWTYLRSYSSFLPQLSASMSMSQTEIASSSATSKSYSYGLNATQNLFTGLSNYYNLQSAQIEYAYNEKGLEKARSDAYYEARIAFINLIIAQENIKLQKNILDRQIENERLVKLQYDSGKEDKGNLMQNAANRKNAEYNLSSAERALSLAQLKLAQLLGSQVISAESEMEPSPPPDADFQKFTANSSSYLMAKYQLEQAEIAQKATVSEFLPSVSLSGSWRRSGQNWPPDSENKSISLNLSYSFFPGGSNIADSIINNINLSKAREDFIKSEKDLRYNIEESYIKFKDAVEAMKIAIVSLAAAEERVKIAMAKYLNGLTTYDEWNRIETDYISSQKSALSSRKSALDAEAAWQNSYGGWVK